VKKTRAAWFLPTTRLKGAARRAFTRFEVEEQVRVRAGSASNRGNSVVDTAHGFGDRLPSAVRDRRGPSFGRNERRGHIDGPWARPRGLPMRRWARSSRGRAFEFEGWRKAAGAATSAFALPFGGDGAMTPARSIGDDHVRGEAAGCHRGRSARRGCGGRPPSFQSKLSCLTGVRDEGSSRRWPRRRYGPQLAIPGRRRREKTRRGRGRASTKAELRRASITPHGGITAAMS